MMQEAGNNSTCNKILSIQSQLGGLSFYCKDNNKFDFRVINNESEIGAVIATELLEGRYDEINYYHNSPNYILIPRELFDENMSDAYLLTKGITPAKDETITITLRDEMAFISVIKRDIIANGTPFVVFPLIAKCIANCNYFNRDVFSYIIEDNMLHITYGGEKALKFCETLTLASETDVEFFIEDLIRKFHAKKNLTIFSLHEKGAYAVSSEVNSKYKIKKMSPPNYFEL